MRNLTNDQVDHVYRLYSVARKRKSAVTLYSLTFLLIFMGAAFIAGPYLDRIALYIVIGTVCLTSALIALIFLITYMNDTVHDIASTIYPESIKPLE